mmetsp:Transcript_27716/g.61366  ORF Transcript_27716/g.61366 Transcript_27716/m.61366 type:complete len:299 (+) Transcript_27716:1536-2432(+)
MMAYTSTASSSEMYSTTLPVRNDAFLDSFEEPDSPAGACCLPNGDSLSMRLKLRLLLSALNRGAGVEVVVVVTPLSTMAVCCIVCDCSVIDADAVYLDASSFPSWIVLNCILADPLRGLLSSVAEFSLRAETGGADDSEAAACCRMELTFPLTGVATVICFIPGGPAGTITCGTAICIMPWELAEASGLSIMLLELAAAIFISFMPWEPAEAIVICFMLLVPAAPPGLLCSTTSCSDAMRCRLVATVAAKMSALEPRSRRWEMRDERASVFFSRASCFSSNLRLIFAPSPLMLNIENA